MDITRTLNELDPPDWGPAPDGASGLISLCHAARQKPLSELTVEDLRILVGQNIALPLLVPLALERLRQNPLSQGDFYPGDLLVAILSSDASFWQANDGLAFEVTEILDDLDRAIETLREPVANYRSAFLARYS
jgi:hypothetical protein